MREWSRGHAAVVAVAAIVGCFAAQAAAATYPRIEASFDLPDLKGNPFDFTENDCQVTFGCPDGREVRVPAFFDGGTTWRVRLTPQATGRHAIRGVTLNNKTIEPPNLAPREFEVAGPAGPGFVRIDPRARTRFAFDNGDPYYPLGQNSAWGNVARTFEKMGGAGENWSRVWMVHWGGTNLDWVMGRKPAPGELSLDVARRWDEIVETAERHGIRFQMVLQHHGQYSTRTNPNWNENPWNTKNGGWLAAPEEFFTDARAAAQTRAKYRYIIARWGCSPAVMAWELFNEVEWTDAMSRRQVDAVAAWHSGMAAFLRSQDAQKHLVTTSSYMQSDALWRDMDYFQPHAYPLDPLAAIAALQVRGRAKPIFFGEFGPAEGLSRDDGRFLHRALWASLMSEASGAAQYWAWDTVERNNLYGHFRAAARFVKESGMAVQPDLVKAAATVETAEGAPRGPLVFSPGGNWGDARQTEFEISPAGDVPGAGAMPAFLHGSAHRAMFPAATFKVNYPADGTFAVTLRQIARAGARLVISVDGKAAAEKDFPAAPADRVSSETVEAKVGAGAHVVKVENTGPDWVTIRRFTLTPYVSALGVLGKANKDFAVLWVYGRGAADAAPSPQPGGVVVLDGLGPGKYTVVCWDTVKGERVRTDSAEVAEKRPLRATVPASAVDTAVFVRRE